MPALRSPSSSGSLKTARRLRPQAPVVSAPALWAPPKGPAAQVRTLSSKCLLLRAQLAKGFGTAGPLQPLFLVRAGLALLALPDQAGFSVGSKPHVPDPKVASAGNGFPRLRGVSSLAFRLAPALPFRLWKLRMLRRGLSAESVWPLRAWLATVRPTLP